MAILKRRHLQDGISENKAFYQLCIWTNIEIHTLQCLRLMAKRNSKPYRGAQSALRGV